MAKKSFTATVNPISFMIGKGSSFERRDMVTTTQRPFAVGREWMPRTAIVKTDALGFRAMRVTDLSSLLQWATRALARDNNNLLILDNLLRQPMLAGRISDIIYPSQQRPEDTSVPIITFTTFHQAVRKAVEQTDPRAAEIPGIVDIVTYTYGRPAIEQGFVLAAREMIDITLETDLIPTYEEIKSAGLATLLEHVIEGTKTSFASVGARRIVPKMMFETIRTTLSLLSERLIEMRFKWESFDALAAVSVARLTGYFDAQPERVAFLKNPDIELFVSNFTLVQAAIEYFKEQELLNILPSLVDADAYLTNFRGTVSAITQSPLLRQVPLEDFISNTHVTRLMAPNKLLLALIMEPSFVAETPAQVSYMANTDRSQGLVLTPMPEMETHVKGIFQPIHQLARANIVDLHNVIVNAVLTDGDAIAAEAAAALALSTGADVGPFPGALYTPDLLTKNMSESYLAHVGAAYSSYIGVASEDQLAQDVTMTFFFSATNPDIHYLTASLDTGLAATQDPALVIALRGDATTPVSRATGSWPLGEQNLDDNLRRALVLPGSSSELAIFPDEKNAMDKRTRITFQLSAEVARTLGQEALDVNVSIYELFGGPSFADDNPVVQVHYVPALSLQTEGVLAMLASLYERTTTERGRNAAVTAGVKLMQPFLQSREFQIAYRGLMMRFAAIPQTSAQRMFFVRSAANVFDVVDLQIALAFLLLLRTRLLSHDTYESLKNAKIWHSSEFRVALATSITS